MGVQMDLLTVILGLGGAAAAGWVTTLLAKARKFKLVKDILDSIADGEITKEELEKIVADIKELVAKK